MPAELRAYWRTQLDHVACLEERVRSFCPRGPVLTRLERGRFHSNVGAEVLNWPKYVPESGFDGWMAKLKAEFHQAPWHYALSRRHYAGLSHPKDRLTRAGFRFPRPHHAREKVPAGLGSLVELPVVTRTTEPGGGAKWFLWRL